MDCHRPADHRRPDVTPEFPGWGLRRLDEECRDSTHYLFYRDGTWMECVWRPDLKVNLSGLNWFKDLYLNSNVKGRHRKK